MRGGFLPPMILCSALGLALAFLPFRRGMACAAIMSIVALSSWLSRPSLSWIEPIYVGCWVSVIACAILACRPQSIPIGFFALAAANVGAWAGAVTAVSGQGRDLAIALPCALLFLPGRQVVMRGWGIGLKVVSSWLTAVAILATMVSLTATPGYVPDHME